MSVLSWIYQRFTKRKLAPVVRQEGPNTAADPEAGVQAKPDEMQYFYWQPNPSWIDGLRFNPLIPIGQMRTANKPRTNPSGVYTFGGMTFSVFKEWISAPSKGKYFNALLKGRYSKFGEGPR